MRFKRVYIEITNICNLSCSFCSKTNLQKRSMTLEEFTCLIDDVKNYSNFVYFHIKGEPLLHPLISEFFDICGDRGIQVNITTNGTLLKQNTDMLLSKSALRQVNLSLHSFNEQDNIDNDMYVRNVLNFAKSAAEENGKYVVLRLWNLDKDRNVDEGSRHIMNMIKEEFPLAVDIENKMSDHRSIQLAKRVFISWEQEFVWPSLENPHVSDNGMCHGARNMVGVLVDGTVVPCCLDAKGEAGFGNAFTQGFGEIVDGKDFRRAGSAFTNRKLVMELCKHCSYRTRFDALDERLVTYK